MYGLSNLGCGCGSQPVRFGQVQPPSFNAKRDILSGAVAFGAPLLYHRYAPKKWPRTGKFGNVAAVVGIYILSVFIYNKVATP